LTAKSHVSIQDSSDISKRSAPGARHRPHSALILLAYDDRHRMNGPEGHDALTLCGPFAATTSAVVAPTECGAIAPVGPSVEALQPGGKLLSVPRLFQACGIFLNAMTMGQAGTFNSIRFTPFSNPSVASNPTPAFVALQVCSGCATIAVQLAPV
jgi:hypothetical protein